MYQVFMENILIVLIPAKLKKNRIPNNYYEYYSNLLVILAKRVENYTGL